MNKKWKVAEKAPKDFFEANKNINVSPIALQLLYNRGIKTQSQIEDFLRSDYEKDLRDPFLFKDMERAVKIIVQAILAKNKIVVHGDYDADGVTSAAVIYEALKLLGANVEVFLPHREEDGYGINLKTIEKFKKKNIDLIITVDCGISNVKEIELAKKYGMKVVVTDHHQVPPEIPMANAVIDPKVEGEVYPEKNLAGAGIAYKLACALLDYQKKNNDIEIDEKKLNEHGGHEGFKKWLLDLVAIGTVADIAPLIGENRTLVKYGLIVLGKTRRPGLKELFNQSGVDPSKIDTQTIGFIIGPRLNAAGRLKHANIAFDLLTTSNESDAAHLASLLASINTERQQITDKMVGAARLQIIEQKEAKIYFAYNESWTPGVVGLVAGKLTDELNLPTMVMTKVGESIVGSGRSITHYNITEALFEVKEFLSRFGGHSQACGFTITSEEHLKVFQNKLCGHAASILDGLDTSPTLEIDDSIPLDRAEEKLCQDIELLEPFGEGNPKPKFLIEDMELVNFDTVGADGKHLRLLVKNNSPVIKKMIGFGIASKFLDKLKIGDRIDAVVEISDSRWNGRFDLQMKIIDLRLVDKA
ncbi:MAG: single-stranded-DNA-specific exonuclease RecJ [Patescibacteria group bacterium]